MTEHHKRTWTVPELLALADRLIARGTSKMLEDQNHLKSDTLSAGRILAHLLLTGKIDQPIKLGGNEGSPPTA